MGNLFTLCSAGRETQTPIFKERPLRQEKSDTEAESDDKPILKAMIQPVNSKPINFEERGRNRFGM